MGLTDAFGIFWHYVSVLGLEPTKKLKFEEKLLGTNIAHVWVLLPTLQYPSCRLSVAVFSKLFIQAVNQKWNSGHF